MPVNRGYASPVVLTRLGSALLKSVRGNGPSFFLTEERGLGMSAEIVVVEQLQGRYPGSISNCMQLKGPCHYSAVMTAVSY